MAGNSIKGFSASSDADEREVTSLLGLLFHLSADVSFEQVSKFRNLNREAHDTQPSPS